MSDEKRKYTNRVLVVDQGMKCPHCGGLYKHRRGNFYPNGNQRINCGTCNRSFVRTEKAQ